MGMVTRIDAAQLTELKEIGCNALLLFPSKPLYT